MMDGHLTDTPLDQISVTGGFRTDLGDIEALIRSIERVGLLCPLVVTQENLLVCGHRRLAAVTRLRWETVPCWVATRITDEQNRLLAIRDDDERRKQLTPIEQAELYAALEEAFAADAALIQQATRFTTETGIAARELVGTGDGGEDSSQPLRHDSPMTRARTQAALEVTGRNGFQRLEQIRELQAIAADPTQDPWVQDDAANALLEVNLDGHVAGRYQRVKIHQTTRALAATANDPDQPEPVRHAAAQQLSLLQGYQTPSKEALRDAKQALKALADAKTDQPTPARPPADSDAKDRQAVAALIAVLRRDNGWWNRHDPILAGRYATDEQWAFLTAYRDHVNQFLDRAAGARAGGGSTVGPAAG